MASRGVKGHVGPMVSAVGAAEETCASDAEHEARTHAAGEDAMSVDGLVGLVHAVAQVLPFSTPIHTAHDAADLYCAVEDSGVKGAGAHHQDPPGGVGAGAHGYLRETHVGDESGPGLSAVGAGVDAGLFPPAYMVLGSLGAKRMDQTGSPLSTPETLVQESPRSWLR